METARRHRLFRNIALVVVIAGIITAGTLSISSNFIAKNHDTTSSYATYDTSTSFTQSTGECSPVVAGNFTIGTGNLRDIIFDPINKLLYVSSPSTNSIYVVSPQNGTVVDAVSTPVPPESLAFDPSGGDIYYSGYSSGQIFILNTTTNSLVTNVTVGSGPSGLAYDPANSEMYVSVGGTENGYAISGSGVVAINGTTYSSTMISSVPFPAEITYDARDGLMYVASSIGDNTTVFNATTNSFEGNIFLPYTPYHFPLALYDSHNGNLYFANYESNLIMIVNGTENSPTPYSILNSLIGNISLPYAPSAMAIDTNDGSIWVGSNATGGIITVISAASDGITNTHFHVVPSAMTYDSANQEMYVLSLTDRIIGLSCGY